MDKKVFFTSLLGSFAITSLLLNIWMAFAIIRNVEIFQRQQINNQVLDFRNMFTEKVLLADKEIDFNTRLSLETSVRNLGDQEILDQWQKFTENSTSADATLQAKNLLRLLINRTSQ